MSLEKGEVLITEDLDLSGLGLYSYKDELTKAAEVYANSVGVQEDFSVGSFYWMYHRDAFLAAYAYISFENEEEIPLVPAKIKFSVPVTIGEIYPGRPMAYMGCYCGDDYCLGDCEPEDKG